MTRLETVKNIIVIVAAVTVIGTSIYSRFVTPESKSQASVSARLIGKPLPLPVSLVTGNKGTIALFVSKTCRFCTQSMGFYRHLAELKVNEPCDIKLVALGPKGRESSDEIRTYLRDNNLSVDGLDVVDFLSLGVEATPTLVLRDSSKLVRGVWVGAQRDTGENEVISKVKAFCHT